MNNSSSFMLVKRELNELITVSVPAKVARKNELDILIQNPQGTLATGIIVASYGTSALRFGVTNDLYLRCKYVKDPNTWLDILYKHIMRSKYKPRTYVLNSVYAALVAFNDNNALMETFIHPRMIESMEKVRQELFLKTLSTIPTSTTYKGGLIDIFIDDVSWHLLRSINFNIEADIELWQAVTYVIKVGLIASRLIKGSTWSKHHLKRLIVLFLHISQVTLSRIGN